MVWELKGQRRKRGVPGRSVKKCQPLDKSVLVSPLCLRGISHFIRRLCLLGAMLGIFKHRVGLLLPFVKWENWSTKQVSDLPRDPNLVLTMPKPLFISMSRSVHYYLFRVCGQVTKKWPIECWKEKRSTLQLTKEAPRAFPSIGLTQETCFQTFSSTGVK